MPVLAQCRAAPALEHCHSHLSQTCSLSNQFCDEAILWMCVYVCTCEDTSVYVRNCAYVHIFPQVTNHWVKDEAAAVDRLRRRAGNHRCHWKCVIHAENEWRKWEQRSAGVCFTMRRRGGIHWFCDCNHRSQTQHIFALPFVSRSTRDWNPLVVLSWMPNRVMVQCLPSRGISITFCCVMLDQRGSETNSMSNVVVD